MPKFQDLLCVSVAAAAGDAQSGLFLVVSSVDTPMAYLASKFMNANIYSIFLIDFNRNRFKHITLNQQQ